MSSRRDPFREKMRRAARRPPDDAALLRSILRDINSSISRLCTILETADETTVVSKDGESEGDRL